MQRLLSPLIRPLLATVSALLTALALAQSPPVTPDDVRALATRFGLTPAQARAVYQRLDANDELVAQLARQLGVQRQTLRAIALELDARNPGLDAETFINNIRALADKAASAQQTLAGLQQTVESLDPGGERSRALAILKQAQAAFDAGRLQEAEAAFAELAFLRRSELGGARKAWLAATDLQARSAALRGDLEAADRIRTAKSAELARQRQEDEREQWRNELARAGEWYDRGDRLGRNADLLRALQIYRDDVLPLAPRERVPLDWATTQNNLGAALSTLGQRESGTARLEAAVQAYSAALQERTRERVPLNWATTQNNLGNALRTLGERESGTARLEAAVQAYSAAQAVYTQETAPVRFTRLAEGIAEVSALIKARRAVD